MHDSGVHHLAGRRGRASSKPAPRSARSSREASPERRTDTATEDAATSEAPSGVAGWQHGSWDFLSGELERDRRNLRLVMETVGELYGHVDPVDRMRHAVDRAVAVTEAERGFLLIQGADGLTPRVARDDRGGDLPLGTRCSRSVIQEVWESGEPVVRSWNPEGGPRSLSDSIPSLRLKSIMAMRLLYDNRPIGVLYVDARSLTKSFTESERRVFLALGGLVATALENARLEAESVERACTARRLRLAREVQMRLLPRDIAVPEGFDVAGVGRVCHDLSGDYYDVLPRPDGTVALVIGDVSGHNVAAALHMATARALVRRMMDQGTEPAAALAELNPVLERDMQDCDFMSLFIGVLDPSRREVTYASAGHNPPLVQRADGSVEELPATGPVLNVVPDHEYGTRGPVSLAPGDVLLLYTDGLYECRDAEDDLWGEEALHASLGRHAAETPDAEGLLHGVLQDADAHRGAGPLDDDITALAVRVAASADGYPADGYPADGYPAPGS